jgi:hypothetical protein
MLVWLRMTELALALRCSWAAVILVDLIRPPFMMCAFNGTAGCPLKTCLMTREAELRKQEKHEEEEEEGKGPALVVDANIGGSMQHPPREAPPAPVGWGIVGWVVEFFSAFTSDSAFRYLWLYSFIASARDASCCDSTGCSRGLTSPSRPPILGQPA